MHRPSLRRSLVAAVVVVAAATGGVFLAAPTADAFIHLLLKPIVQTVSLSVKRGQTYERLEAQRDEEIGDVKQRASASEWQFANGWIDADAAQREQGRFEAWTGAISDRTEREKTITRSSYNRAIGMTWKEAAIDALTGIKGIDAHTRGFVGSLLRGEAPLQAAIAGLTASGPPTPDDITLLRDQWINASDALSNIRIPAARSLQVRLKILIGLTQDPAGTVANISGLEDAAAEMQSFLDQVRDTADAWTVKGARIQNSRFERDTEWQQMSAHVQQLAGSTAGRALIAGMARQAVERVRVMAEANGLTLDDDALILITTVAAHAAILARLEAKQRGDSILAVDMDAIVRVVINEWLASAGQDPLLDPPPPLVLRLGTAETTVLVGDLVRVTAEVSGGGRDPEAPAYEFEWFVDPVPVSLGSGAAFDREFSQAGEVMVRVVVREPVSDQEAEGSVTFTVEALEVVTVIAQVTSPFTGVPNRSLLEFGGVILLTFPPEGGRVEGRLTVEFLIEGPGRFSLGGPSVNCNTRNRTTAEMIGTFEPSDSGGAFSGTVSGTTTLIDFTKDNCDEVLPDHGYAVGQTSDFGPFSWRATVVGGVIISGDLPELAWEFSVAFPAAE